MSASPCKACGGAGFVDVVSDGFGCVPGDDCTACGGTGRVYTAGDWYDDMAKEAAELRVKLAAARERGDDKEAKRLAVALERAEYVGD